MLNKYIKLTTVDFAGFAVLGYLILAVGLIGRGQNWISLGKAENMILIGGTVGVIATIAMIISSRRDRSTS